MEIDLRRIEGSNLFSSVSRMKLLQCLPQKFPVQVCIDFRSGDTGMSQHFLYGPEIGASFYQVGGKGVAESVG